MLRQKITILAVAIMFFWLVMALVDLQLLQGTKFKELSNKNCIRLVPKIGARGKIFDREGNIIVDNKLCYDVIISPQEVSQLDKTLEEVARVLGVSRDDLKEAYKSGYLVSSLPITIAKNIDVRKAIALEEFKLELPGMSIQPHPQRSYPYGKLAASVIGYVNEIDRWRLTKLTDYGYKTKDIVGFGGVEEKYDYYLRQEDGGRLVEVDHRDRFIRVLGTQEPRDGKDIQLTLNLKIQKIVEDNLGDRKGCVIIMDPYTGEVIAMASSPSFNPAVFVQKSSRSLNNLFKNPNAPLMNRAISATYPAGSIFKLIVATAALETGKINLSTSFLCQGKVVVGREEFACWDTHGVQNLTAAIAHSCNVFFYKTGLLTGAAAIHDYAIKLGLSRVTSFELPYEASGFIPSPLWRKINKFKNWFDGDTANLSIGQGEVLVTPIQMVRVIALFANQGNLVTPYIVGSIDGRDITRYQRRISKVALRNDTIGRIREGLKGVISDPKGTANVLSDLPISVAGKTGTAQAPPKQPHAWFVGFFPFHSPKFAITVLLEHGGSGYYASVLAKDIINMMIKEGLI